MTKKYSYKELLNKINIAKKEIKKSDQIKDICKEYDFPLEMIDYIPIMFKDIDVSARTEKGVIYLNFKLLEDGNFNKDYGYLIHEITHFAQQCFNSKPTKSSDSGNYLKNIYEQEAFKKQIEYIEDEFGEKESNKYVDDLLDYHDVEKKDEDDIRDAIM